MSDAFVQWRYGFENNPPAINTRFLSAFANALIAIMFELGYNVFFEKSGNIVSSEQRAEIEAKIEDNRKSYLTKNQNKIKTKRR